MHSLRKLEIGHQEDIDLEALLRGTSRLSSIVIMGGGKIIVNLVKVIDQLKALRHVVCRLRPYTPALMYPLGQIDLKLLQQAGSLEMKSL